MNNQYDNFGFNINQNDEVNNNENENTKVEDAPEEQYYSMGFNTELPKKKRGGGIFGIFLVLILIIGLVVFLLDYTGKIDAKGVISKVYYKVTKKDKKETKNDSSLEEKEIENLEEEIAKLCEKVDEKGFYNKELSNEISTKLANLSSNATVEEHWEIVKGSSFCFSGTCYIYEDDDKHTVHEFVCETKQYKKYTLDEEMDNYKVQVALSTVCSNLDPRGSYSDSRITCNEFVCKVKIDDKEYSKNCKE